MYKKGIYKILTNEPLTDAVWRMTLAGDTQWISAPGQFVNIALEGKYLRRPISICDYDDRSIALIYKVVGGGTEQMSRMLPGETLDLLTGLGNGFSTKNDARRPLLVGGGVGVPPLYNLAKRLLAEGKPVQVVLGFNTASEVFYEEEFRTGAGFRLLLRLRAAADAPCALQRRGAGRPVVVRRAHGVRIRRLHGLFVQNQIRLQTYLQGGAGPYQG